MHNFWRDASASKHVWMKRPLRSVRKLASNLTNIHGAFSGKGRQPAYQLDNTSNGDRSVVNESYILNQSRLTGGESVGESVSESGAESVGESVGESGAEGGRGVERGAHTTGVECTSDTVGEKMVKEEEGENRKKENRKEENRKEEDRKGDRKEKEKEEEKEKEKEEEKEKEKKEKEKEEKKTEEKKTEEKKEGVDRIYEAIEKSTQETDPLALKLLYDHWL